MAPSPPPLGQTAQRCAWAQGDPMMEAYHDHEWGRPEHDSRALFEKLLLDGLQAGLSWRIILYRRAGLRDALDGFDPHLMARYDSKRMADLLADPRLIRNRLKVAALVANARSYLALQAEGVDFAQWLWAFVEHAPVQHRRPHRALAPTTNAASMALSKALKKKGMGFVGPTICYAFMQAVGMINDHDRACPQYALLGGGAL